MANPTYILPSVNFKPPQIVDSGFYCDIMFDPDDSAPDYIGMNLTNGANTSTNSDWKVYKLTKSGSNVTRIQVAYGTWAGRAALFP